MAYRLKLDDSLDMVARVLAHRPELSLNDLKAISAQVTGMADADDRRARIQELADQVRTGANPVVKR